MVCKRVQLESVMLLKFMAQLALCVSSSLVELMATMGAIVQLSIIDQLKLLRKSLKCLLAKHATGADILHPIVPVEGHVKPFNLEACAGLLNVALRQKLCHA